MLCQKERQLFSYYSLSAILFYIILYIDNYRIKISFIGLMINLICVSVKVVLILAIN